ncbi:anhydro-N-acetylmuramic acid kinase, partial [Biomphalaria glabrata]
DCVQFSFSQFYFCFQLGKSLRKTTTVRMTSYYGIGIMSGTSLDGLDMCYAEFTGDPETDIWGYRIEHAVTVTYSKNMQERLGKATTLSGIDLVKLHIDYSHFVGQCLEKFIESRNLKPDFISSHGHTVFHQPDKGITFQLGDGEVISSYIRCPFVCNFRSKDVSMGGQGAPLVPCGEKFLFQQTDLCINLGGIANVGCKGDKGFDVCPCNMVLNRLTSLYDPSLQYDKGGEIAATGKVLPSILEKLDELDYYKQTGPRSLGYEWISNKVFPILNPQEHPIPDLLRTFVDHITDHITSCCIKAINKPNGSVLVTGGGAFNTTLMLDLKQKLSKHNIKVVDAEDEIVEYKEALIFAFLGLRSLLNMENVFCSVTGSKTDCVSGSIHHGTTCNSTPSLQDRFNFMIRKRSLGVNELRIIREK